MPKTKTKPKPKPDPMPTAEPEPKLLATSNKRMADAGYSLIAVWLPQEDADRIRTIAADEVISAAAVMRRAVRVFLSTQRRR